MALSSAVLSSPRQAFDFRFIHMLRCSDKAARRGGVRPGREVGPKEDGSASARALWGSDLQLTLSAGRGLHPNIPDSLRSNSVQALAREAHEALPVACRVTLGTSHSLSGAHIPPLTDKRPANIFIS